MKTKSFGARAASSHGRVAARITAAVALLCSLSGFAGEHYKPEEVGYVVNQKAEVTNANGFLSSKAVAFGLSIPIRDLPKAPPPRGKGIKDLDERNENPRVRYPIPGAGLGESDFVDPLLALNRGDAPSAMPSPAATYDGMTNAEACGCLPPDTNGDIGPTHYVQTVNVRVSIYNRATGARVLGPDLQSSAFFSGLPAGNSCRTSDDGDPVVLYDPLADRWMISQFEVDDVPGHQCIAISQTGDPTGAYFAYDFVMPNGEFHDYPHYGVWPDGYYMADHMFNQAGTAYTGAGFFAFDRAKMLAGDPSASYIFYSNVNAGGHLPVDLDGFVAPPAGLPHRFVEFLADEFGSATDGLRVYELVPNYANPGASTFTTKGDITLAAFDARAPTSSRSVIEQSGTAVGLDAIADRLMFRVAYRNLGSAAAPVNSYVGTFTVNVSGVNPTSMATYQAGERWFELRSTDTGAALPTVRDQGTQNLAPGNGAGGVNNFMGSIAQDAQGNLALGFSQSSSTSFPNIVIAGRTGPGTGGGLNEGEASFFASGGSQTSSSNRWGDYSAMGVDPTDECTFWYTQEYYASTSASAWRTRFGKFTYPGCTTPPRGLIAAHITDCGSSADISGATVSVSGGFSRQTNASGALLSNIGVPPATYTVSVSKTNYSTYTDNAVVVTDGNTTTVSACITGSPAIASAPPALVTAENYLPLNSAPDPGETVTVSLPLHNTSTTNSTNLVATLQASGGVTAPSAPQNYGVLVGGGANVSRDFSFTAAGTCGDDITLTLTLQDGALNLGTATFTMQLGTTLTTTALSENFDGVTAPALPAGWTTAQSGAATAFVSSITLPNSVPNDAYSPNATAVGNAEIVSPAISVPAGGGQVSFRNLFNLEDTYDGGVLEIAVNGGAFADITTGGNAFLTGGYTDTISSSWSSPIGGRQAWSGLSGGTTAAPTYLTSTINLPAAAAGQSVQLKWRSAADSSVAAAGANGLRIDDVTVSASSPVCSVPAVNTAPTITGPANANINEDAATGALAVTVGDTETAASALVLSGSSSDTVLVPNANIVVGGSGSARTVTVTPAADRFGTATITLTVTDGGAMTATATFDVIVAAVNDKPAFTLGVSPSHPGGSSGAQTSAGFVASTDLGPNEGAQTVIGYSVTETADPNGIVSGTAIAADGTLTYTLSGLSGTANLNATLQDSGGTANGGIDTSDPMSFTITVGPLTDAVFADGFE